MSIVSAVLLKAGTDVEPESVMVNGLESIQSLVGGNIEAVRIYTQQRGTDESFELIGYCDDEGLVKDSDINWLASALFQQKIHGNVVVVTNAGDGEDADVPDTFTQWLMTTFLQHVVVTYNQATFISRMMSYAVENNIVSKKEVEEVMEAMGEDIDENDGHSVETIEKTNALLEKISNAIINNNPQQSEVDLVDEIEDWLKQETEK
jgi:hypothetical protein